MARLTMERGSGREAFMSSATRKQLIQKLGRIEESGEELIGMICDGCCRFPREKDEEELENICAGCPASRLMELME